MAQINTKITPESTIILPPKDSQLFKKPVLKTPATGDHYIYFSVWDFSSGKWKPQKYYSDLNSQDKLTLSKKIRSQIGEAYLADVLVILQKNINPKTGISILPKELIKENLTIQEVFADLNNDSPIPRLSQAVKIYLDSFSSGSFRENQENSLTTYTMFLNQFSRYAKEEGFENYKLDKIEKLQYQQFLDDLFDNGKIKEVTYNNYKGFLSAFVSSFADKYDFENLVMKIKKKKVVTESDRFTPFTDEDLKKILRFFDNPHTIKRGLYMQTLKPNYFLALVSRVIYHSFLRPSEVARIKVKHLKTYKQGYLLLTKDITKSAGNTKLLINEALIMEFEKLGLEKYFENNDYDNYYVFTPELIPLPTPTSKFYFSKNFSNAIKKKQLGLAGKGYSLYSFKHTGNINYYNQNKKNLGFEVFERLKLQNRHATITQTETYLRKLNLDLNFEKEFKPIVNFI